MKPGAALMERFEGWFVSPIEKLKELPEGDGGFLALSAALFLCERYYRAKTNTHEKKKSPLFMKAAAQDMGLSLIDFNRFWQVYRNGMLHQGMPKRYIDPSSNITFRAPHGCPLYFDSDLCQNFAQHSRNQARPLEIRGTDYKQIQEQPSSSEEGG